MKKFFAVLLLVLAAASSAFAADTIKWTFYTDGCAPRSTAISPDNTVYMTCGNYLYAINPDGSSKWTYSGLVPFSDPAVGPDGTVYVVDDHVLTAIVKGKEKWSFDATIYPPIAISPDGTIYASGGNGIYSINPDGTENWFYQVPYPSSFKAAVVAADGIIYAVGGGPHRLKPGEWTDDTSMALCLAESLIECMEFNPVDQMKRYVRWYREGHLSSTGQCFDIGGTTHGALTSFERTGEPYSGSTDARSAGNGSIMRLAPVPLFFAGDAEKAIEMSGESSRTTHGNKLCIDACRYLGTLIVGAVRGASKEGLLSERYCPVAGYWGRKPLVPEILEIAMGSFKKKNPPAIKGTGYVVASLEAALWAFYHGESFKEGCLLAVNLGDDADTTGAVYGQLAGAFYGEEGIPEGWRNKIVHRVLIVSFAGKIAELAGASF